MSRLAGRCRRPASSKAKGWCQHPMTNLDPIRKTYRFQLRPTKPQAALLDKTLGVCCELYNDALHERRDAWKLAQHSVSYFDQTKELRESGSLTRNSRSCRLIWRENRCGGWIGLFRVSLGAAEWAR